MAGDYGNGTGQVVPFNPQQQRKDRPPPLTDAEVVRLRALLKDFDAIKHGCPVARRILEEG